jgi:hypothetical protein
MMCGMILKMGSMVFKRIPSLRFPNIFVSLQGIIVTQSPRNVKQDDKKDYRKKPSGE